jgi:RNA polymerase sigma-70 factor (ECF subfamily)
VQVTTDSFEAVFRESYPRLVALGTSMAGDAEVARELAQETMLRAHNRWDELCEYDHPGAWLRRVMSNLLIDHHRSSVAERSAVERIGATPTAPESAWTTDADRWAQLMRPLTPQQRIVVTFFYGEDASVESIASMLDMSTGAVKSTLFKARRRLERALEGERNG